VIDGRQPVIATVRRFNQSMMCASAPSCPSVAPPPSARLPGGRAIRAVKCGSV
jgi:hypothetical protein